MNNNDNELDRIGFFGTIITELKLGFKDGSLQDEIRFLSKVISVALFLDKKITLKELKEAKEIIKIEMCEDWELTWNNILIYIEKYKDESTKWMFVKNKEEVLNKIISERKYLYAEYLVSILKSDGIKEEEKYYLDKLNEIIRKHKELLSNKGLL